MDTSILGSVGSVDAQVVIPQETIDSITKLAAIVTGMVLGATIVYLLIKKFIA